jgi:hypothetical protein
MSPEEAEKWLSKIVAQIGEEYDCVQILVSRSAPELGGTERIFIGSGNWYARSGMAAAFLQRDKAQEIGKEVSVQLPKPPPDDAEEWKTNPPP